MRATLLLPLLLAAAPASAQVFTAMAPFCGGALVAEQFSTQVVPGAMGRAEYSMTLRNARNTPLRAIVQVTGDMMGKPSGAQAIAPGQRLVIQLGSSPNLPGRPPLRNEQLANAVRVSCHL